MCENESAFFGQRGRGEENGLGSPRRLRGSLNFSIGLGSVASALPTGTCLQKKKREVMRFPPTPHPSAHQLLRARNNDNNNDDDNNSSPRATAACCTVAREEGHGGECFAETRGGWRLRSVTFWNLSINNGSHERPTEGGRAGGGGSQRLLYF